MCMVRCRLNDIIMMSLVPQILRGYSSEQNVKCLTLIQSLLTKSEELSMRVNYLVSKVSWALPHPLLCTADHLNIILGPSRLLESAELVV